MSFSIVDPIPCNLVDVSIAHALPIQQRDDDSFGCAWRWAAGFRREQLCENIYNEEGGRSYDGNQL